MREKGDSFEASPKIERKKLRLLGVLLHTPALKISLFRLGSSQMNVHFRFRRSSKIMEEKQNHGVILRIVLEAKKPEKI